MPLPLPNLDDRTFNDLSLEMRSLIQRYDKTWTNHNTSDPGITLIELFAWLAELLIYRMNRVESRNYLTFLELIGIKPSGPQAVVTFEIRVPREGLAPDFVLRRGTRVSARDERTGREVVFETISDLPVRTDNWDPDRNLWVFKATAENIITVENELIGFSNGSPRQEFTLKQLPVSLTPEEESFIGNPVITEHSDDHVIPWTYKADLLSSGPDDEDFTVEPLTGVIRFGDGATGRIPPPGARLTGTYRHIGGSSGNVPARALSTLIDPLKDIDPAAVAVFNEYAATGGTDQETLDDMMARGLASLLEPHRAVSDTDFEYLAARAAPGKVARVKVVANRNLAATTPDQEGHISVIILPVREQLDVPVARATYDVVTKQFTLGRTSALMTTALMAPRIRTLHRELLRYLDERRLITSIVHIVDPSFTSVQLKVVLQARAGVNIDRLNETVGLAIAMFLDPYEGWEDHEGWPYNRRVYRSELYQLIEAIAGVDHVKTLTMNGGTTQSFIDVGENHLVALDTLTVSSFLPEQSP